MFDKRKHIAKKTVVLFNIFFSFNIVDHVVWLALLNMC